MLLTLPILLPIISALLIGLMPFFAEHKRQRDLLISTLAACAFLSIGIALADDNRLLLWRLTDTMQIILISDAASGFITILISVIFCIVGVYAVAYMKEDKLATRFFMFYLLILAMLIGSGFAGNLITMFFFIELATFASVPLVLHGQSKEAIAAAFKYLYYAFVGTALVLVALFFIHTISPNPEFIPGGAINPHTAADSGDALLWVCLFAILGFGVKAGMFPLHAWLPDAHPVAPAPASAVLSGVITKIGVFAIFRFIFYLIGPEIIRGSWLQSALFFLALSSIIVGSVCAFREPLLKRRFAYSSISQIGYIILGFAVLHPIGLVAAMLHTIYHSITKDALFLISGNIIKKTGQEQIAAMHNMAKTLPLTMTCFALCALALVGIPPGVGFISKWYLLNEVLQAEAPFYASLGSLILLFSSLMAAAYLFPSIINAFFPAKPDASIDSPQKYNADEPGIARQAPIIVFTISACLLGFFQEPLLGFIENLVASIFI